MPSCVVAALHHLPRLLHLELCGSTMPQSLPAALQHLQQLEALTCVTAAGSLPGLSALFPLTQLRNLCWEEEQRPDISGVDVQQIVAQLPRLEAYCIGKGTNGLLHSKMQVGDAILGRCHAVGCDRRTGTVHELQLFAIQHVPSLQHLAAASLPPGVQPGSLRSLRISLSSLQQPAVLNCSFLGQLRSLALQACKFPAHGAAAVLEALLQQAPRLRSLSLMACLLRQPIPAVLVNRTGLRHLCLRSNGLSELPPGPYLSSLESLDLTFNRFTQLPPALTAATNVRELSLAENADLALTDDDINDMQYMRALECLYLGASRTPARVLCRLGRLAPHLEVEEDYERIGQYE